MEAHEAFQEELQRYDPALRARWSQEPIRALGGRPLNRFVIERKTARFGWIRVMIVQGDKGEFRPLDSRTIHRLAECDTWRFGGQNLGQWKSWGRRAFLNSHKTRESEDDPYKEPLDQMADQRYTEAAAHLGERLRHVLSKDPGFCRISGEEEKRLMKRADDWDEVQEAKRLGRGILEMDPTDGHVKVRKGSTSSVSEV
jgi:hypothetical protein